MKIVIVTGSSRGLGPASQSNAPGAEWAWPTSEE